ncbi:MAG: ABC transporter permease [Bacteroidetes bacterium]|nr:ABC transporter permease [Bacteroidota bacterium]MCW5894542.1 ABC transporter permease [Bacteroidota bacterium]
METREIVIEAGRSESQYWKDLWRFRELLFFLTWRDILVRYKQTVIGVAWALIRPLLTMVVFTVLFGRLAKLPSEGVPYPVLVFAALLPWQLFAGSLTECSHSLIKNASMISKTYFPRMLAPLSAMVTGFADFLLSLVMLGILLTIYEVIPDWRILTVPLFAAISVGAALGLGLWFAALNVKYRDFMQIVPFVVQIGLYVSPVGFASSIVPEEWRTLYYLNPVVGAIDGFRWAVLGTSQSLYLPGVISSVTIVVLLCVSGVWYFRKTERTFADII